MALKTPACGRHKGHLHRIEYFVVFVFFCYDFFDHAAIEMLSIWMYLIINSYH